MRLKDLQSRIYGGDNLLGITKLRYLPRWVIIVVDVFLCLLSFIVSCLIFSVLKNIAFDFYQCILTIGIQFIFMLVFRAYSGVVRHSTFVDLFKVFLCGISTMLGLFIIETMSNFLKISTFDLLLNFVYFPFSFLFLFLFRCLVKELFRYLSFLGRSALSKKILIFGTHQNAVEVSKIISENPFLQFEVEGFVSDKNQSSSLSGFKIYREREFLEIDKNILKIDGILISKEDLSDIETQKFVEACLSKKIQIFKFPMIDEVNQSAEFNILNLQIEDLLNRTPIEIDDTEVIKKHLHQNVLVTGGAGSIGGEILEQISSMNPAQIVVIDQAETPLNDLELKLRKKYPKINYEFILADVSDEKRLRKIFHKYAFDMVYHAAAYKHVPVLEKNIEEAVRVNVQGTKNIATLSSFYGVKRFVMVSTDKAVNPTSVMGVSKRVAELFVQSLQNKEGNQTGFMTTRFGNVLGSNGSVIPIFRKQIENRENITVTHPDVVRYFMTISEACKLVLQASTMGNGGEIFVFNMGEPIKILDLARKMISLSGLQEGKDIEIVFTGLRPGEKLYEELLTQNAEQLPTHHPKIMISKEDVFSYDEMENLTQVLLNSLSGSNKEIIDRLKMIVKEYKTLLSF